jgi:hypothetical protein
MEDQLGPEAQSRQEEEKAQILDGEISDCELVSPRDSLVFKIGGIPQIIDQVHVSKRIRIASMYMSS